MFDIFRTLFCVAIDTLKRELINIKRRKISKADKLLWEMLVFVSAMCFLAIAILGVLPSKYMAVILVVMVMNIFVVKSMQKRACASKKRRKKGRGLIFVSCIIMLVTSFYMVKIASAMNEIVIGETNDIDVTEQPFHIYISGIDVYGELTTESRSDVNLIATVNPKTHKILITTTPRDYYVSIPGVSGDEKDKLTHAGIYGMDASINTLEKLYDIEIPFFVRVNFTSVIEMVDALGGIDVNSEISFTTGEEAGAIVEVKEGMNHFNGTEALAFVRERKAFVDGDNQRGKNQQALLTALIKEVLSPKMLIQGDDVIDSFVGNVETNMSETQMKSLIRRQIEEMSAWKIETVAATGDDTGKEYCYSYPDGPLYVTIPNSNSVNEIKTKMTEMLLN